MPLTECSGSCPCRTTWPALAAATPESLLPPPPPALCLRQLPSSWPQAATRQWTGGVGPGRCLLCVCVLQADNINHLAALIHPESRLPTCPRGWWFGTVATLQYCKLPSPTHSYAPAPPCCTTVPRHCTASSSTCPLTVTRRRLCPHSAIPVTYRYLQQLLADTSSPELHLFLCKRQLNTAACRAVASCLRACAAAGRAVRSITLSGCGISCEGEAGTHTRAHTVLLVPPLRSVLLVPPLRYTSLLARTCFLTATPVCAHRTIHGTCLNSLSIGSSWRPFPPGLTALCDGLRHCSFTLILDLSHNAIGDTGAAALAAVLGNLSCLINVQLGGNAELGDLGAAALAAAARSCPSLRRIALRGTAASIFSIKDINSALSANAKRAVLARGKSGNALANAISSVVAAAANGITVGPDRPITWDGSCSGAMPAAAAAAAALPGLVSAAAAAAAGNPRVTVSSSGRRASSSSTNGEDPVFVAQLCGLLRTLVQPVLPAEMAVMRLVSELVAQRQAQGDAASAQQHQQLQQEGFGLRGPDLDTYITPGRKRFGRVSELDCIADEAADIAVAAGPFPDLAHGFDTVSSSSGSGSPSAEAEAEGRGAAETAALLSYLADGLMRYGYDVAVTHTLGGGAGGQCLRNLRHTFLSVTCPRQHPDAASNPNSAPCSLAAAGATLAGAAAAAAATVTATGSLGTNSVGGSLSQPYGATAVQMPCHAGVIIVDPELREQFDVANPTPRYEALVGTLPRVYVGAEERLPLVVEVSTATILFVLLLLSSQHVTCYSRSASCDVHSEAYFSKHHSAQQCTAVNLAACRTRFHHVAGLMLLGAERSLRPVLCPSCAGAVRRDGPLHHFTLFGYSVIRLFGCSVLKCYSCCAMSIMHRCCATKWPWRSAPRARCSLPGASRPP